MINLVELFSGIGSQAKALKNLGVQVNTLGTSEWDVHAIVAYDLIHNPDSVELLESIQKMEKEELLEILRNYTFSNSGKMALEYKDFKTYSVETLRRIYYSVTRNNNFVDISSLNGCEMSNNIDLLTYSFPCQDLSNVGAFHGYNRGIDKDSGSRSSLLWQVGRILTEMKQEKKTLPKYLLMENVPTLLSDRHFTNFSSWICDLKSLGYVSKYYQLNAADFGLPQNRPRLLMISVFVGDNCDETQMVLDYFRIKNENEVIKDYRKSGYFREIPVCELLRTDYNNRELFEEAVDCTPNNTVSRQKIWDENPKIVLPGYEVNPEITMIRTITTKQDRNPNSGNLYFESGIEGKSGFRYLTPRECMLFMGFTDEDYSVLKQNNLEFHKGDALFSRDKIIRMAGNSIPVKLLEGIFLQIIKIENILTTYRKYTTELSRQNKQNLLKLMRSELFRRRIRCRQGKAIGPEGADVIYPKYNTAIYIMECFEQGHGCEFDLIPENDAEFWEQWKVEKKAVFERKLKHAEDMGWKPLTIWHCELCENKIYETIQRVEKELRNNLKNGINKDIKND